MLGETVAAYVKYDLFPYICIVSRENENFNLFAHVKCFWQHGFIYTFIMELLWTSQYGTISSAFESISKINFDKDTVKHG